MNPGLSRLSERERDVLRLLIRGHDAKSMARALGLSVHAVNERLREARRKLGVTSSREAARILAAEEASGPNFLGDKQIGVGGGAGYDVDGRTADARRPPYLLVMGGVMILLFVSAIAVGVSSDGEDQGAPRPGAQPRVTATSPAAGAVIRPGPFLLSVTFDQPMRPGSYSFVQKSAETYPDCGASRPAQSRDGRTFILRCTARPGRRYEIWFNSPPYMNFTSPGGVAAEPFQLLFRTRGR